FFQKIIDWLKSLFFNKELELSILGLQNAGKTTLVNLLANNKFDEDTIPTIGFNFRKLQKGKVEFKLWDLGKNLIYLGGQPRFRDSWEKYCRTADAIVYVVDSSDIGNLDISKVQLHALLSNTTLENIPLLVLGNKCDLVESLTVQQVIERLDLNSIKDRLVACYSISCKNGDNIDNVLKWL
ncbi:MAG: ADP-ribosylation factor-like protein, partial [Flammeovirgaceae bacterium]